MVVLVVVVDGWHMGLVIELMVVLVVVVDGVSDGVGGGVSGGSRWVAYGVNDKW